MLDDFKGKWTVTFLGDGNPPKKLVFLRRGDDRKFAPGLYTGIGGKFEPGEDEITAAKRELLEETGIAGIPLNEFGRLIINKTKFITYSFGIYQTQELPSCPEGTLEWANMSDISQKEIIPDTRHFLDLWRQRGWGTDQPFTVYIKRGEDDAIDSPILSSEIKEGLHY